MAPKNKFTIVSYYTKDNEFSSYEAEANLLKKSMEKFGLDTSHIEEYKEDTGIWSWNTHYKMMFIKNKLKQLNSPVVWTDADSRIKKYPELFNNLQDYDFAANCRMKRGRQLLHSGTMFFNNNSKAINLLDDWIEEDKKIIEKSKQSDNLNNKKFTEQEGLRALLKRPGYADTFNIYILPDSYHRIKDGVYSEKFYEKYKNIETIIEHSQASVGMGDMKWRQQEEYFRSKGLQIYTGKKKQRKQHIREFINE
jgi:hypothetical protein